MFWTPPSIPWLTLRLWFIWLGTASWNFLVTSSECQRKSLLEDMLCTFQPLAKGDLVDHVLHTLIMYKDCLGIMKEQCKNSRLPHLLMIVVHGETLWSPAPQPMDDDDLGVELASALEWKHHIQTNQRSLNSYKGIFHRCPQKVCEQAYMALVRPTLEYAATVWDPYHQKEVNSLERVQREAVRYITSRRDSVSALRSDLGLPTLQQRRLTSKFTMFYKIHHQEIAVEIPNHYVPSSTPSIKTRKKHTDSNEKDS